jgi:hypothetical protein
MRVPLVCLLFALGCAANPYDSYKAKNPDWYGEAPTAGASLHETLAGLYAPPVAAYSRTVQKLDVLRLEAGVARKLGDAELDEALATDAPGDYGVVATVSCLSEVDMQRYYGEKVAWYLLQGNRLVAWDHFEYVDRCTGHNDFRPARGDDLAQERIVLAHRDASFPRSMEHTGELYLKGLAYLGAKRPEDAEAMLRAGDASVDVGQRGERHVDYENAPAGIRQMKSREIDDLRERLVRGLERRETARAAEAEAP